jgi:hypothetical protein
MRTLEPPHRSEGGKKVKTSDKVIMNRVRRTPNQISSMLLDEAIEWNHHGDCQANYDYHQLAMEVRYLRADIRAIRAQAKTRRKP